jgi:hypothetical protein
MRQLGNKRKLGAIIVMTLLLLVALPATSFAQNGRWRGRDRDNWNWSRHNRHDSRNRRWDGRARGERVGNVFWRNRNRRFHDRRYERNHWRQFRTWRRYR